MGWCEKLYWKSSLYWALGSSNIICSTSQFFVATEGQSPINLLGGFWALIDRHSTWQVYYFQSSRAEPVDGLIIKCTKMGRILITENNNWLLNNIVNFIDKESICGHSLTVHNTGKAVQSHNTTLEQTGSLWKKSGLKTRFWPGSSTRLRPQDKGWKIHQGRYLMQLCYLKWCY